MSVFVHAGSVEGGGVKRWQNSVHVVVELPMVLKNTSTDDKYLQLFYFRIEIEKSWHFIEDIS